MHCSWQKGYNWILGTLILHTCEHEALIWWIDTSYTRRLALGLANQSRPMGPALGLVYGAWMGHVLWVETERVLAMRLWSSIPVPQWTGNCDDAMGIEKSTESVLSLQVFWPEDFEFLERPFRASSLTCGCVRPFNPTKWPPGNW